MRLPEAIYPPPPTTAALEEGAPLSLVVSERSTLACIYSALILLDDDEVTVTEDKIYALIKAAGVNVEPLCPSLFAKTLANVNIGSLVCNVGAYGPATAAGAAPAGGPPPSITTAPTEEKKVEAKKEEESDVSEDDMGFVILTKPLF
nr:60S acidic ribosomal protein P1-like [Saimiri boliviensis boliviensis]